MRLRRLSLLTRTMLLASLAVGAMLVSNAALRLRAERAAGMAGLVERAELLTTMQAEALSVPLWNLDDELLGVALEALARDPDFASAEIVKPGGNIKLARPSSTTGPSPLPVVEIARPIRYVDHGQSRLLGQLRLSLQTGRLEAALIQAAWQRAVWLVSLLSAMLLILHVSFRQLSRPLDLLAGALTRLASGEQDVEIPALHRSDEVGAVARGLQVFKDTAFQLVRAQSQYQAVFDHAALGIYCLDASGSLYSVNAALLALTGCADIEALREGLRASGPHAVFVDPSRPSELAELRRKAGGYAAEQSQIRRADGSLVWITQTSRAVRDLAGNVLGFVSTVEDITEHRRQAGEERMRIRGAVESAADAMLIADADGTPLFVNRAFADVLGHDVESLTAAGGISVLLRDGALGRQLAQSIKGGSYRVEADLLARSGRAVPMAVSVAAIAGEQGEVVGSVTICTDLTDRRAAEAQIAHMVHHDPLTGLLNRVAFNHQLTMALASARGQGGEVAVLCLDLERFKYVNETLGHAAGDELLQQVAARLSVGLNEGDAVARIGADEFVIVCRNGGRPADAETLAADFMAELSQPYHLNGTDLTIGFHVGVSISPHDSAKSEELLRFANLALYEAKAAGSNVVRRFLLEMDRGLQARSAVERDLRRAIGGPSLSVHYQPQCRLSGGELVGAEALLRWNHPDRGPISPAEFIPIAEETGLIGMLGEWVLRTACKAAASWSQPLRIAVNISPKQFRSGDLTSLVKSALAESGLPPERLELEITEGVMLQDTEATLETLHAIKALGVRLAMDDFGTGYSSLSYLRRMPIDKIKIDQSFIRALGTEPAAAALVRSIIGIGRGLGIEANAEGVETEEQAALLRQEGCYEVQGWHYGRPQSAEAFAALLITTTRRAA